MNFLFFTDRKPFFALIILVLSLNCFASEDEFSHRGWGATRYDTKSKTYITKDKAGKGDDFPGTLEYETRLRIKIDLTDETAKQSAIQWSEQQSGKTFRGPLKKVFDFYTDQKFYRINLALTASLIAGTAYSISMIAVPEFEAGRHWPLVVISAATSGIVRYYYKGIGEFLEGGQTFIREHIRWTGVELGYFLIAITTSIAVGFKNFDVAEISSSILTGTAGGLLAQGAFDTAIARISSKKLAAAKSEFEKHRIELYRHIKGMIVSSTATGINLAWSLGSEKMIFLVAAMGLAGNVYYWKRARSTPCASVF